MGLPSSSSPRRERKRQATAEQLVTSAFSLFEQYGYDAVTMEQIATAADVAKGTLYNHFPLKEALVCQRFDSDLAAALPKLADAMIGLPDCAARLAFFFRSIADYSRAIRSYLPYYLRYRLSQQATSAHSNEPSSFNRLYSSILEAGQAAGEISTSLPASCLADYLEFMHLGNLMRWLEEPDSDLDARFDQMLDLFLHGASAHRS